MRHAELGGDGAVVVTAAAELERRFRVDHPQALDLRQGDDEAFRQAIGKDLLALVTAAVEGQHRDRILVRDQGRRLRRRLRALHHPIGQQQHHRHRQHGDDDEIGPAVLAAPRGHVRDRHFVIALDALRGEFVAPGQHQP